MENSVWTLLNDYRMHLASLLCDIIFSFCQIFGDETDYQDMFR